MKFLRVKIMDISKWSIEQIMQLPDCAFGQRFPVFVSQSVTGENTAWDMSELSIPSRVVLWSVDVVIVESSSALTWYRLGLGDMKPVSLAEMDGSKDLLMGYGREGSRPRRVYGLHAGGFVSHKLRQYKEPQGRKLIIEVHSTADKTMAVRAGVIVSTIPREVPDWLISGRAGHRW